MLDGFFSQNNFESGTDLLSLKLDNKMFCRSSYTPGTVLTRKMSRNDVRLRAFRLLEKSKEQVVGGVLFQVRVKQNQEGQLE